MKICTKCGKSGVGFYKNVSAKDGLQNLCKECDKLRGRNWYEKNKEKSKARNRTYYANNKVLRKKIRRASQLKIRYGLTTEDYDAKLQAQ